MTSGYDGVGRNPAPRRLHLAEPEPEPEPEPATSTAPVNGSLSQLVSHLAGEPLTDRPTCVHPTLGAIARAVDAATSETGRAALRPLASQLVGTAQPGVEVSARLVAVCVSTALSSPEPHLITAHERGHLETAHQTALHLLARYSPGDASRAVPRAEVPRLHGAARWWLPVLGLLRLSEPFYRCFVAEKQAAGAVAVAARASGAASDLRLRQLLRLCLAAAPRPAA